MTNMKTSRILLATPLLAVMPTRRPAAYPRPLGASGGGQTLPARRARRCFGLSRAPNFPRSRILEKLQDFTVEVDVTFESVEADQTILRVTACWEIRLITEGGAPKLQFIGFREPLKPVAAPLEGSIEAGQKYAVKARMEADGSMSFESDIAGSATATLGRPVADSNVYTELFVGSSNRENFVRPLQGAISRVRITAEDAP